MNEAREVRGLYFFCRFYRRAQLRHPPLHRVVYPVPIFFELSEILFPKGISLAGFCKFMQNIKFIFITNQLFY